MNINSKTKSKLMENIDGSKKDIKLLSQVSSLNSCTENKSKQPKYSHKVESIQNDNDND